MHMLYVVWLFICLMKVLLYLCTFSCCVDEVAAEHVGADCIVHYGSACLSASKRLPLMYVFEKRPVDLERCASAFRELYPDTQSHIIILYDVNYAHAIGKLSHKNQVLLSSQLSNNYLSSCYYLLSASSVQKY